MSLARFAAGWAWAAYQIGLCWMLAAPIIAGPIPMVRAQHTCPAPYVSHGVGSDLKTYTQRKDRCHAR